MDYPNHNTKPRKNKHLNLSERSKIEVLLEEGYSAYQIAKRLGRAQNTILNEIKRGSTLQRKGNKVVTIYYPDLAQRNYEKTGRTLDHLRNFAPASNSSDTLKNRF